MADDIIRFMDSKGLSTATIMGHGFGAKLAIVTAIDYLHRFTGLICLEGGPLDFTYHSTFKEIKSYVRYYNR